jgi:hypothetical protein
VTAKRKPRCARCGGSDLFGPAPLRTSAHPNSSSVLVETPGAHFHDHALQGAVCLDCGAVDLFLTPATLEAFRADLKRSRNQRG